MVWHNWSFFGFHISSSKIVTHDLGNCQFSIRLDVIQTLSQYTGQSVDLNNFHNHMDPVYHVLEKIYFLAIHQVVLSVVVDAPQPRSEKLVLFIFPMVQRSVQEVSHVDSKT